MTDKKICILLVDDDEAVRGLARVILEHEGWRVEEAGNLGEAFSRIREGGVRPHIAVVDLLLPDGFGTELADDLRRARLKSGIVYITGDTGWLRRLNGGSEFVLAKPFTPVQLVMMVKSALDRLKPVVVFVEPGRVYARLIESALGHSDVQVVMASTFEEGVRLARQQDAIVLFAPSPDGDDALASLRELRAALPLLDVVALRAEPAIDGSRWYDRRLPNSYSVQEVSDVVRHALNRQEAAEAPVSKGRDVHQEGDRQKGENQD
jgi:DNA-binding response OmpR family regulator